MLEDDLEVGAAMRQWLEASGHTVHHFASGKAIVREAARESFDLFLLDWHVPDLSGADVLKWLREKQQSTVPVLFATSRDSEQDIVAALAAGADDYMIKPVRRMELLARVEALLRRMRPKQPEAESIDLPTIRRAKYGKDRTGPFSFVDRKIALLEENGLAGASAHHHASDLTGH